LASCDTGHPSKIWLPHGYIHIISCGHGLLFALSILRRDDLDFPNHNSNYCIPYDSDDYIMHACIYITFLSLSGDILNLYAMISYEFQRTNFESFHTVFPDESHIPSLSNSCL
ncbi:hypothetical protein F5888DRAFT_1745692, partial [Russula emetica]